MYVVIKELAIYHYGIVGNCLCSMQANWHFEGDTLSVSLCPDDWFNKYPNNARGVELWELSRNDGLPATFIDLERLSSHNRSAIDMWSTTHGFGQLGAPNYNALSVGYGRSVPTHMGDLPLLLAWAKTKDVDGIWFSEIISANMLRSSRGGIFQHRLHLFNSKSFGARGTSTWPAATLPKVELSLL